jgi:hypothetical protein
LSVPAEALPMRPANWVVVPWFATKNIASALVNRL